MGVGAGFAALNGHTQTTVRTGHDRRQIQIEEVAPERRTVRGLGGGAGTACQDLVRARPVKREFVLESLASVFAFTPWRMAEAELYTHVQPTVAKLGAGRSASARAESLRSTRGTVRAWCARTMSFTRFCRSVDKLQ